jgi:hypothetical protein
MVKANTEPQRASLRNELRVEDFAKGNAESSVQFSISAERPLSIEKVKWFVMDHQN